MRRITRTAQIGAGILVLLSGCGSGADTAARTNEAAGTADVGPESTDASRRVADPAFVQLCDVLTTARAGDLENVRATFDHGPLHTLTDAAIEVDRSIAARLLEAKEAVESGLTDPVMTAEHIATDLEELTDAAAEAHAITGTPQTPCEELS